MIIDLLLICFVKNLKQVETDIDSQKSEIGNLNRELQVLRSQNESLREARKEADILSNQNKDRIEEMRSDIDDKNTTIESLKNQITTLNSKVNVTLITIIYMN